MSILEVNEISHVFFSKEQYKTVLEDISLSIDEGEFITFLGPSGCGKTTLLSIIAGLLVPTVGEVIFEGEKIVSPSKKMGYMLQSDYLFPWRTIKDNILLGLEVSNQKTKVKELEALVLLHSVGLQGTEMDYPATLSGGMRQRAALVRTLMNHPNLFLLDEPFSALDYQTKIRLEELVFQLIKQSNLTALLVTHDIEEAIAMSNRIYLFQRNPGRIANIISIPKEIAELPPLQARQHPQFGALFDRVWKEMEQLET
ncbi:MAG: ABC transporter ATP-binding protein [Bacillaceae bacterium]